MTSTAHGGPRPGAGRPPLPRPLSAKPGDYLILERETIGGEIHKPELVRVLNVSADELELQTGNDIIVLRFPDDGEIAIA